jgi:membrane-associated phospholipid phosphatase
MSWNFVTFFGDSTLLLPTAIILFIVLRLSSHGKRAAGQWLAVFCTVGALVCITKLAFMGWGIGSQAFDFTGLSGHSALSATLWPVILWLLTLRLPRLIHGFGVVVGYLVPLVIGYSRLVVHAHSPSEVVTGLLLGFCGSTLFLSWQRTETGIDLSYTKIAATLVLPLILVNTEAKAPATTWLEHIAVMIGPTHKPFTRHDLHAHTSTGKALTPQTKPASTQSGNDAPRSPASP